MHETSLNSSADSLLFNPREEPPFHVVERKFLSPAVVAVPDSPLVLHVVIYLTLEILASRRLDPSGVYGEDLQGEGADQMVPFTRAQGWCI